MGEFALQIQGEPPPEVRASRPLRIYQCEVMEAWRACRDLHRGHMLVSFCGSGKNRMAAEIAKEEPGRVLFLVNRDKLARQSLATFMQDSGRRWELEKAENWAKVAGDACIVATVQSLKDKRLERFAPDAFSLVIADECHMLMGRTYRRPLEYFTGAKLLGLTATPDRTTRSGKQKGYRGLFDNVVIRRDLAWAIDNAWSTPLESTQYEAEVDLSAVKWDSVMKDFQVGSLDEEMAKAEAVKPVVQACLTKCGGMRTVIFMPGVKSAIAAMDALNVEKPGAARVVYGEQDTREGVGTKDRNMDGHKRGDFQFLFNVMILTTGYDDEELQCIVDASPTTSRALAEQKFGRPARLWPGVGAIENDDERRAAIAASPKPTARIVDLAFNTDHELSGPVDVLGGAYTDKERKKAKKILEDKGGDVQAALRAARVELEARAARAQALKDAKATLRERKRAPKPQKADPNGPVTEDTKRGLVKMGLPVDKYETQRFAVVALRYEYLCKSRGWCDYKQRIWLERNCGIRDARGMTVAKGTELAERWKKQRKALAYR